MPLSRYRGVVPEWDRFAESIASPEPVTLRVRSGRVEAAALLPRLRAQGFELAPVEGVADFYRVLEGPGSIAQTIEFWLGLFHIQQVVMALPSLALAPNPGERVLDLCAAPGGKTAHLAELMRDRGPLVAVDPKEKRLRGLLGNLYRLGHPNVLVVAADGRTFPRSAPFDRVLVDAPCSAEGTLRRQGGRVPGRDPDFMAHITSVQEALLRRGIAATRPGGTIVYSTCTFAPEENERVLTRVLADTPIEVEAIPLGLPHAPGLAEWEGERFHPDLRHAWRVYPHQLDSGGLFMVRLRKLEGAEPLTHPECPEEGAGWVPVPPAFPGEDPEPARTRIAAGLEELEHQFGMPRPLLDGLGWIVRGDSIWAHSAGEWPLPRWEAEGIGRWRVVSLGIRALRQRGVGRETPATHFVTRWGAHWGADRRLELDRDGLGILLSDLNLTVEGAPLGPVALLWEGMVLGRGMIGGRGLAHEIPRAAARQLVRVLGLEGVGGGKIEAPATEDPEEE